MKRLLTLCLLFAAAIGLSGHAGAEETGQVAFLTLKIDQDGITMLDSRVVKGSAKEPRAVTEREGIRYEVISDQAVATATNIVDNPLIRHLEYEDPDNPGRLISEYVELDEAVFTVRINYDQSLSHIEFFKVQQAEKSLRLERRSLGQVALDNLVKGGGDE